MKKFLVVLLACAMIFGFASTAFATDQQMPAFSDIADQSQAAQDAIMRLAVLGVLEGNNGVGGAFRPTDNLTRAEFAKIVCYETGNVTLANGMNNVASKFPDVPAGQWYTGWVNAAAAAGYFVGDTVGNFRPNANITQNEVVTVALRMAGYNDRVGAGNNPNVTPIWPVNYARKAADVGLLDNVTFTGTAPATRADAAIICDAALDINMVVYVTNEYAYATGLAGGTIDPDGFSEMYYRSNETNKTQDNETILHKAFNCVVADRATFALEGGSFDNSDNYVNAYDEVSAWDYADFTDGDYVVNFDTFDPNTNISSMDMASTYYVTKGFTFADLAGMEAKVTYHLSDSNTPTDEAVFVNVRGSYLLGKDVYNDNGRVMVDGKSYRMGSDLTNENSDYYVNDNGTSGKAYAPNDNYDGGFYASDSNDTIPAKVYLDKDGLVWAVKDYTPYTKDQFGIFNEMDGNLADYKNDLFSPDDSLDSSSDYAILRDKQFVTVNDLDENDVLYYLGEQSGGVPIFLAYGPAEGDMTRQTPKDGTITIDGYAYAADNDLFQISTDGGANFKDYNPRSDDMDKTMYNTVNYALGYNFASLAYAASVEEAVKIMGVITDTSDSPYWQGSVYQQRVNGLTIFNTEGKSVDYTFSSDFRDAYNDEFYGIPSTDNHLCDFVDTSNIKVNADDSVDMNALKDGDLVQLDLDSSGNVKQLDKYIELYPEDLSPFAEFDVQPNTAKTAVTLGNNGQRQAVDNSAVIFNITVNSDDSYNDVSLMSFASLMASNRKATQFNVADASDKLNLNATVLYMVSNSSSEKLGLVTGYYGSGSGAMITIDGTDMSRASGNSNIPNADQISGLFTYTISDGDVKLDSRDALVNIDGYNGAALDHAFYGNDGILVDLYDNGGWDAGIVNSTSTGGFVLDSLKNGEPTTYVITSATSIYDLDADKVITRGDLRGRAVVVILDGNEAQYVVALSKDYKTMDDVIGADFNFVPPVDPDIALVAAAVSAIEGGTYEIPAGADQADDTAMTAWVQGEIDSILATLGNGVTNALVETVDGAGSFDVTVTKGAQRDIATISVTLGV